MKQKRNLGKTMGLILVSLLATGALVGGAIALNKYSKEKASSPTATTVSDSTNKAGSSSSKEQQVSSNPGNSVTSITNSNQNESVVPTINCSADQEIYWYNTADQLDLNEEMFVATINGLPNNATDEDRELYLWCDDDDLDEWIEFYVMRSGNKVVLNNPYNFMSGETIHAKQIKKAPATGFYKIPVWVYAVNYEPDDVHYCMDYWFYQR